MMMVPPLDLLSQQIRKHKTVTSASRVPSLGQLALSAGRLVMPARIVLLSAACKTHQQIARQLRLHNATMGKWRRRFLEQDVSRAARRVSSGTSPADLLGVVSGN